MLTFSKLHTSIIFIGQFFQLILQHILINGGYPSRRSGHIHQLFYICVSVDIEDKKPDNFFDRHDRNQLSNILDLQGTNHHPNSGECNRHEFVLKPQDIDLVLFYHYLKPKTNKIKKMKHLYENVFYIFTIKISPIIAKNVRKQEIIFCE